MRVRPLLAGMTVAALAFAAFWELAEVYADSPAVLSFDASVSTAIQSLREPWLDAVMLGITWLGSTVVVGGLTVALVLVLLKADRRRDSLFAGLVVAGGALLSTTFKGYFDRVRPPAENALISLPSSSSFPSGHAMGSLCLAWVLSWLVIRAKWQRQHRVMALGALAAYAVLVGISRVYLGVHWPSDVVASWLIGVAWASLVTAAFVAGAPPDSNR